MSDEGYAHPDRLVTTDWVSEHLDDPGVRVVESDEDVLLYDAGHIPGAVKVDWHNDLQQRDIRDYIGPEGFAELCSRLGIGRDTLVVFYGDKHNWWAAYALWVFEMFGHSKTALMDGGREKWREEGRELTREVPDPARRAYPIPSVDLANRAFRDEVLSHQRCGGALIDVRSPAEFRGELTHMADYPQEGALRGGHIPGAANVPWAQAVSEDGTFKSREELERLYVEGAGLGREGEVVAYCRIGERSSHTWFALKYLLGFDRVRNYDGSWTEWGNLVGMPIERGDGRAMPSGGGTGPDAVGGGRAARAASTML